MQPTDFGSVTLAMRKKLRFSTRWIFALTAVVAVVLWTEEQRLAQQRELAKTIETMHGRYQLTPRDSPAWFRRLVGEKRSRRVDRVFLPARLFPDGGSAPYNLTLPDEFTELLHLAAMKEVTNLYIWGSSATDSSIAAISNLASLRTLKIVDSCLTQNGMDRLKKKLEQRNVIFVSPKILYEPDRLGELTSDLTLFVRAQRGNVKAVDKLVMLAATQLLSDDSLYTQTVKLLSTVENEEAIQLLHTKVDDSDPRVRHLAVQALGARGETAHIATATHDPEPEIAVTAIVQARALLDKHSLHDLLVDLYESPMESVRYEAIRSMERLKNGRLVSTLLKALSDNSSMIRSAAARQLGRYKTDEVQRALDNASRDPDAFVRKHALVSLNAARGTGKDE